jgi:hypothetical protein
MFQISTSGPAPRESTHVSALLQLERTDTPRSRAHDA